LSAASLACFQSALPICSPHVFELGQPMSAIRLVCAPELVDELRPLVKSSLVTSV